ncbi:MAG: hypothetical protein ACRDHE_09655, partial [Ktedonobacterales bacterium]
LAARAAYLEPGITIDDDLILGLRAALAELARFLGADTYHIERAEPSALARYLNAATRRPRKRLVQAHATPQS